MNAQELDRHYGIMDPMFFNPLDGSERWRSYN